MAPPPPKLHRTHDHISFADVEMVMSEPSQSNCKNKAYARLQGQLAKQRADGKERRRWRRRWRQIAIAGREGRR